MGKRGDLTATLEKEKEEKNELSMSVTKGCVGQVGQRQRKD